MELLSLRKFVTVLMVPDPDYSKYQVRVLTAGDKDEHPVFIAKAVSTYQLLTSHHFDPPSTSVDRLLFFFSIFTST